MSTEEKIILFEYEMYSEKEYKPMSYAEFVTKKLIEAKEDTKALSQTRVSGSTDIKTKPIWTDYHLNGFKWYRKWRKCKWYKHQFTNDALQLSVTFTGTWWALYGKINRYSDVIETEEW